MSPSIPGVGVLCLSHLPRGSLPAPSATGEKVPVPVSTPEMGGVCLAHGIPSGPGRVGWVSPSALRDDERGRGGPTFLRRLDVPTCPQGPCLPEGASPCTPGLEVPNCPHESCWRRPSALEGGIERGPLCPRGPLGWGEAGGKCPCLPLGTPSPIYPGLCDPPPAPAPGPQVPPSVPTCPGVGAVEVPDFPQGSLLRETLCP